jgi:branched-chain amino acid transport system permease protein
LRGHYLAVATLGFGGIMETVFMQWTGMTGGADGIAGIPGIPLGPLIIKGDLHFYYLVWAIALLLLIFSFNIINTRTGRVFKAIHGSEVAANSLGINVNRYKSYIFIYSALVAGIGGWLLAHYITFISPGSFGIHFSVLILCMVVIGGQTSIWGPVFGAIVFAVFPILLWASEDYDTIIYGIILMVVVMFMPKGMASFVFDTTKMINLGHKGIKK